MTKLMSVYFRSIAERQSWLNMFEDEVDNVAGRVADGAPDNLFAAEYAEVSKLIHIDYAAQVIPKLASQLGFEPDKFRDAMYLYWPSDSCASHGCIVAFDHVHPRPWLTRREYLDVVDNMIQDLREFVEDEEA